MNFSEYSLDTQLSLALSAARGIDRASNVGADERRILLALSEEWQQSHELRRAISMDKGQLSRILDKLTENRLVLSKTIYRHRLLKLSAAGVRAREAARATRAQADAAILQRLTRSEVAALPSILCKLANAL